MASSLQALVTVLVFDSFMNVAKREMHALSVKVRYRRVRHMSRVTCKQIRSTISALLTAAQCTLCCSFPWLLVVVSAASETELTDGWTRWTTRTQSATGGGARGRSGISSVGMQHVEPKHFYIWVREIELRFLRLYERHSEWIIDSIWQHVLHGNWAMDCCGQSHLKPKCSLYLEYFHHVTFLAGNWRRFIRLRSLQLSLEAKTRLRFVADNSGANALQLAWV